MASKVLWRAAIPLGLGFLGFRVEHHYSVDVLASDYVAIALAFRSLQSKSQEERLNSASPDQFPTPTHLVLDAARRLRRRTLLSRQLRCMVGCDAEGDPLYRLDWIAVQLQTISSILEQKLGAGSLNFEEQCRLLYNTVVDAHYIRDNLIQEVHAELDEVLPKSRATMRGRYHAFRHPWIIPKVEYEDKFRIIVDDMMQRMAEAVPELKTSTLEQKYIDDPAVSFEAACETAGPGKSELLVNIARPITWDKAQQLSVHELTHHLQNVLMQQYLYPQCPEMRVALDEGPMATLLEGGAELAVELFLPPSIREEDLSSRVPEHLKTDVAKALTIEHITWTKMFPCVIRIAREFINKRITREEAIEQMEQEALKDNDSWPNVAFVEEYGAYIHGYGWCKELIHEYLKTQSQYPSLLDAYIAFVKRPVTPSYMAHTIAKKKKHQE